MPIQGPSVDLLASDNDTATGWGNFHKSEILYIPSFSPKMHKELQVRIQKDVTMQVLGNVFLH